MSPDRRTRHGVELADGCGEAERTRGARSLGGIPQRRLTALRLLLPTLLRAAATKSGALLVSYPLLATRSELPRAAVRRVASRPFAPRHVSVGVGVVSSSDAWLAAPGEEHQVGHHDQVGVVEMLADRGVQ